MIAILKALFYMVFIFFVAQAVNFFYNFLFFYFKKNKSKSASKEVDSLNMLQCDKCKTYVLKSEAYFLNGKIFCKKEHSN